MASRVLVFFLTVVAVEDVEPRMPGLEVDGFDVSHVTHGQPREREPVHLDLRYASA